VTVPTAPADPRESRSTVLVQLDADGAVLIGARLYGQDTAAARSRAQVALLDAAGVTSPYDLDVARRVLDFLNAADRRAAHAEQVGPPVTGPVPAPPARPRVRLRTEVEVDGLPSVDLAVYVHPSAVDTTHAVTSAARALHDAALAALHVLVVEPADPAGGAS